MNYEVFHRTWWTKDESGKWPDGREAGPGKRHHIGYARTEEEARTLCKAWNDANDPGDLSDKAEYEEN